MSDEYHTIKNGENEIDDFLNEFDKISNGFDKGGSASRKPDDDFLSQETNDHLPSNLPGSRLDRLNESRTRKKGNNRSVISGLGSKPDDIKSKINTKEPTGTDADPGATMVTKRKKKKKYHLNVRRLLLTLACLVGIVCASVGVWALTVINGTPQIDADNLYSMLSENSILYDDEGNEVENLFASGSGLRTNLDYTQMPENLTDAFVAIEDKTFWEHKGFNIVRIFGAIFDGLTSGDSIRGTSTITQQLARNLYLEDTKNIRSIKRKVQEAYYAIQLERQLSKEQIIEAYLNTIYLGSGANGVQAAAQTYFSKDAEDLTLAECAVLASIPKNPSKYSPIKRLDNEDIPDPDSLDFVYRGDTFSIWYQNDFVERQQLALNFMKEQEYIDEAEYQEAMAQDIRAAINPNIDVSTEISSYFADYVVEQVVEDLMFEYDIDEADAKNMIYNGGLRIYSTLNVDIQKIAEAEFESNSNFPSVTGLNKDSAGNARDDKGKILLYKYSNMFDSEGNFTLKPEEYQMNEDGSMTIFKGNRLNFYRTEVQNVIDYSVEFKGIYTIEDGIFYSFSGGYILIPTEYKKRDDDGNLIISKEFFGENSPFELTDTGVVIAKDYYQLTEKVIQPQSAMVIMDYKTGGIKAMVGGRNLSGKLLFNRATSTRQPGSAIKPMAVYSPALQRSVDMVKNGTDTTGKKLWTAASIIDDAPYVVNGKLWPKNWYAGYRGLYTLRQSVEQSVNVNAVQVLTDIGPSTSLAFLKKLGVTSVVESGDVNDMNAAALALGGMTRGISPLQMAAGYGAFPNQGVYTEPISYTKVTNKKSEVLLECVADKEQVMDRGVAFIMTDILRTTVSNGIAGSAAIGSQPTAGKTGTTTDNYDAWFVGITPYYSAALWIGNDMNLELSQGSGSAARLWSKIMKQVHSGLSKGSFPSAENITSIQIDTKSGKLPSELSALDQRGTVRSEYFVTGTAPVDVDDIHVSVTVCADSGYLATPYCSHRETKVMVNRPKGSVTTYGKFVVGDIAYEAPDYYCNLHNIDTSSYPIDPNAVVNPNYIWDGTNYEETDDEKPGNNGNGNNGNGGATDPETPITDSNDDPIVDSNNSNKPGWLN
ncbi:MAG: transglycosylase domain-containing protein [Caldisericia bacterium]|nr:transglycosylase domain-containing protein [Caldisericia bacterium]